MIDLRLAVTDQTVGDQPIKIKCKEHNDKNASLAVYPDHVYCYGCKFSLKVEGSGLPGHIDPLAYLLGKVEVSAQEAAKYTTESLDRYRTKAAQEASMDPLPRNLAVIYNAILNGVRLHRKQWLYDRGLTDATIDDPNVLLGHDGIHFVIPVFDRSRNLVSLRYRMDPEYVSEQEIQKHKYYGLKGRNGLYLYPEPLLTGLVDTAVVCEGELDALRLWQEGEQAVTVTNGAGQTPKIPRLIKDYYPHVKHLIVATDQDEAGEEAGLLTVQEALGLGFEADRMHWDQGKDITEMLQARRAA